VKRKTLFRFVVLAGLVAVVGAAPAAGQTTAAPQTAAAEDLSVVSSGATASAADVQAYWTAERMASATAMDLIAVTAPGGALTAPTGSSRPAGAPHVVAPKTAGHAASAVNPLADVEPQFPPFNINYNYPPPFTRYDVGNTATGETNFDPTAAQYSVSGKVFFTQLGGNFVCSGTAQNSNNLSVVWTAGHCVHAGNNSQTGWSTNVMFVPAYQEAGLGVPQRPFGSWIYRQLWTSGYWYQLRDLKSDTGAIVVNTMGPFADTLVDTVGGAGFWANASRIQHWHDFGYPQAAPFNGQKMTICTASHASDDNPGGPPFRPATMSLGCDMTGGSSGGSWQIFWGNGGPGYTNSHNSYKYISPNRPLEMWGPYFDNDAWNVFNAAQNS
jgi:hypothetical protein